MQYKENKRIEKINNSEIMKKKSDYSIKFKIGIVIISMFIMFVVGYFTALFIQQNIINKILCSVFLIVAILLQPKLIEELNKMEMYRLRKELFGDNDEFA